ncbi:MAG: alpha-1,4-glucan--maltose-1-phosphate maltosyltransferase [Chloroflexaceae bacterium]|nr:alpha-1,4-glucan--maltose-1-phosphate maltosyltransferase [Chloroflexaceae bacterium]
MLPEIGQQRVIIEGVSPEVDAGRYAIKRVIGEPVIVEADIFVDGHDALTCMLLYQRSGDKTWQTTEMEPLGNDRWRGTFCPSAMGTMLYTIQARVDHFRTWQRNLHKRIAAEQDVSVDLLIGADLVEQALQRATDAGAKGDARRLSSIVRHLRDARSPAKAVQAALNPDLLELSNRFPDLRYAVTYAKELPVTVDRERARFSAWYELFPRSTATTPDTHGTFADLEARLPYIASMGFDIVYLPPIHPIGVQFRKGKNNRVQAEPGDVGSPWAIGGAGGGHTAILPQLGTLDDFRRVVQRAKALDLEIALDIAFQCSPDHPWLKKHPDWFRQRPDGTIQYAENPPKKYQDIYPINFENDDWENLWKELRDVMLYWVKQGVKVFRVDNPHTKSFRFWEWAIAEIRAKHPDVIFLSEAFSRPRIMYNLAKLGFTQSYTYFTWRNSKYELTEYLTELTQTEVKEYFRPNFWPNTPDILHAFLQHGGLPACKIRLILAAMMTASYGMYGPVLELGIVTPREPGSEEYLDSEKYQLRYWELDQPHSLHDLIARVNQIRRTNVALQSNHNVIFHPTDNEQIICFSKHTDDHSNRIVVVASLDPINAQSGWVGLDLAALGIDSHPYHVHDLLADATYLWNANSWNYVELNPQHLPAHIFRI